MFVGDLCEGLTVFGNGLLILVQSINIQENEDSRDGSMHCYV